MIVICPLASEDISKCEWLHFSRVLIIRRLLHRKTFTGMTSRFILSFCSDKIEQHAQQFHSPPEACLWILRIFIVWKSPSLFTTPIDFQKCIWKYDRCFIPYQNLHRLWEFEHHQLIFRNFKLDTEQSVMCSLLISMRASNSKEIYWRLYLEFLYYSAQSDQQFLMIFLRLDVCMIASLNAHESFHITTWPIWGRIHFRSPISHLSNHMLDNVLFQITCWTMFFSCSIFALISNLFSSIRSFAPLFDKNKNFIELSIYRSMVNIL
jgi:hypothetical protein